MRIKNAYEELLFGNIEKKYDDFELNVLAKCQSNISKVKVKRGQGAKMIFNDPNDLLHADSMWVVITRVIDNDHFVGILDNYPFYVKNVKYGDRIEFKRSEIMSLCDDKGKIIL